MILFSVLSCQVGVEAVLSSPSTSLTQVQIWSGSACGFDFSFLTLFCEFFLYTLSYGVFCRPLKLSIFLCLFFPDVFRPTSYSATGACEESLLSHISQNVFFKMSDQLLDASQERQIVRRHSRVCVRGKLHFLREGARLTRKTWNSIQIGQEPKIGICTWFQMFVCLFVCLFVWGEKFDLYYSISSLMFTIE